MAKTTAARRIRPRQGREICQQITDLIIDYVTGGLDRKTVSEFEAHLRICPDCVAFLKTYRKTIQLTRSLRYDSIPARMERRLRKFIKERTRTSHQVRKRS